MVFYQEAAMDQAMKIQEVILRAMVKKVRWRRAPEIRGSFLCSTNASGARDTRGVEL